MKLSLPTIVDNHNDVPGVFNVADSGDAAVPIANNIALHDGNNAVMAINDAPNNDAPNNNAPNDAPNDDAPNNAPNDAHNNAPKKVMLQPTMFPFLEMLLLLQSQPLPMLSQSLSMSLPMLSWDIMMMSQPLPMVRMLFLLWMLSFPCSHQCSHCQKPSHQCGC